jgi:hypothetical protein
MSPVRGRGPPAARVCSAPGRVRAARAPEEGRASPHVEPGGSHRGRAGALRGPGRLCRHDRAGGRDHAEPGRRLDSRCARPPRPHRGRCGHAERQPPSRVGDRGLRVRAGAGREALSGPRAAREPFVFRALGTMAAFGHSHAAADVRGFRLTGFPAWWVRRTYYLFQMPRWDTRLRITLDWTVALFFRPNITKVDLADEREQQRRRLPAGGAEARSGGVEGGTDPTLPRSGFPRP